jgi:hypothetical protein
MIRYVIAMGLFFEESYEEVMRRLVGSLKRLGSWADDWQVPTGSAICQARQRLGVAPLKELFDRAAVLVAELGTKGAWLARRRLVAIDGTSFNVADSRANEAHFGSVGSGPKASAFPKLTVMALAECGSHAIVGAVLGTARTGERTLAAGLDWHGVRGVRDRRLRASDHRLARRPTDEHGAGPRRAGAGDLHPRPAGHHRPVRAGGAQRRRLSIYTSISFTARLVEAGVDPSVGSVGDALDNALAETTVGSFKNELIRRQGPWRDVDHVEVEPLNWIDWFNNQRPYEYLDDLTPVAAEHLHYAHRSTPAAVG